MSVEPIEQICQSWMSRSASVNLSGPRGAFGSWHIDRFLADPDYLVGIWLQGRPDR